MTEARLETGDETRTGVASDTLGLLAEASQLACDLGYDVREEPLGDLPGGLCRVRGVRRVILNLEHAPAARLECLLEALREDPRLAAEPKSRLLAERLRGSGREPARTDPGGSRAGGVQPRAASGGR